MFGLATLTENNMPFTPFHFGPSACVSLPLHRYIDFPVFILANIAIDIEPLMIMTFNLPYPLHGIAHTLLGAFFVGGCLGISAYCARYYLANIVRKIFEFYSIPSLNIYVISGITGACFHILLDAPLYTDIMLFYPFSKNNPLLGLVQSYTMYSACAYAFAPAIALYLLIVFVENKRQKITSSL